MRRFVALASAVLVAAVGAGVWFATRHDANTATAGMPAQTTTVEITQRDLVIYDETTATLGFTTSVTVASPVAGTVTSVIAAGGDIDPGTVVATIDGAPVVALTGDVPSYRDLADLSASTRTSRSLRSTTTQPNSSSNSSASASPLRIARSRPSRS